MWVGAFQALSFSADGKLLASADADGSVAVWHVAAATLGEIFLGHSAAASGVALSPDGATLYSASFDGSVIAWDVTGERRLGQQFSYDPIGPPEAGRVAPPGITNAVAVTPDSSLFATSPGPGRVTLWHSRTLTPEARELRGPVGTIISLAFSRDGRLLAAAGSTPDTPVWDVATGKLVRVLRGGGIDGASAVAFSVDDVTLALAGGEGPAGFVRLYDLRTGAIARRMVARGTLQDVDFSSDGKLVAASGLAGKISVWNLARPNVVATMTNDVAIYTLRFSPDGKLLASGDQSGNVDFWDVARHVPVGRPLGGHNGLVGSVSFDPSGKTLATVSSDGNFRIWDVASRKLIGAPLPGAGNGGWGTFFPDGKHVIAGFFSGIGVIWNVDPSGLGGARVQRRAPQPHPRGMAHLRLGQELRRRVSVKSIHLRSLGSGDAVACDEITWLAVHSERRRRGVGTRLVERLAQLATEERMRFLLVTTLSASVPDDPGVVDGYEQTRAFYERRRFMQFWEPTGWWDETNQCLLMVRTCLTHRRAEFAGRSSRRGLLRTRGERAPVRRRPR